MQRGGMAGSARPSTVVISNPSWGCLVGPVTAVAFPPQYTAVRWPSLPQSTSLVYRCPLA